MPKPVSEQVIVITGASSGIGLCTARHLAARGDWLFHRMDEFTLTDIPDTGDNLERPLEGEPRVRGGWLEWGWSGDGAG